MSSAQSIKRIERLAKVGVRFFLLLLFLKFSPAASLSTLWPHRTLGFTGSALRGHAFSRRRNLENLPRRRNLCGAIPHHLTHCRAQEKPDLAQEKGQSVDQGGMDWNAINNSFNVFSKMALPYFREEKSARVLLAIVIAFTLLNSGVSVGFSYLSRDFWSALNTKDTEAFYPTLGKYAIALTGGAPIAVLYRFYREKLSLQWRAWMTLRILDMWQANRSFYDLEMKGELDNPDQRIQQDAASFTDVSLDLSIKVITSVIDLVSFSGILYSYPNSSPTDILG